MGNLPHCGQFLGHADFLTFFSKSSFIAQEGWQTFLLGRPLYNYSTLPCRLDSVALSVSSGWRSPRPSPASSQGHARTSTLCSSCRYVLPLDVCTYMATGERAAQASPRLSSAREG
ncbi:hypothetical protein C8Q74DRAFT_161923 [Fomes fomentarius]|nr:hypothetical protein C8Q74DRAFT_161923 [Fomes fomentarius]